MRLGGERESSNVEDARGGGGGRIAIGGGIGGLAILLIATLLGVDPRQLLNTGQGPPAQTQQAPAQNDAQLEFVKRVLGSTETTWGDIFQRNGSTYREPKLRLFTGQVESACGVAGASVGPFYCPGDERVYIDLSFYDELQRRFGAPGDFAQAYVIAHEVGHHVQNLLGLTRKVDDLRTRVSKAEFNRASVRLELQADFLAGVWAHHTQKAKHVLESGDLEEALRAATAIGDDN